ncbi:MAG TPA: SMP-30/gluconolactonase/LRE family protein [Cytophagaceae bacterium]|jgi:YVTN family beta-propeller protein
MKSLYILFTYLGVLWSNLHQENSDAYIIMQNRPSIAGEEVSFSIKHDDNPVPTVAWDFGDGTGLGKYQSSNTTSHKFLKPGVYRVFARIKDVDIPISVVHTVTKPLQKIRPTHSSTIVLDTLLNQLWVVNTDNNSVTIIDSKNYSKISEIEVGRKPRTVALDRSGNAWVANEEDASISVISKSGVLIKTIALPYASRPYGVCFNPQQEYLYVSLQATNTVLKLNQAGEIVKKVEVGYTPRGIAISSDGQKIFVTRFISPISQGEVTEIDVNQMIPKAPIPLAFDLTPDFEDRGRGVPNYLSSITISPDGSEAWISSKKDNVARGLFRDGSALGFDNTVRTIVSKIDLVTNKENSTRLDLNDSDMANAVEFSIYGNLAFIAVQGNNKVHVVNAYNNARVGSITNTGLAPQGLVFSEDGTKLFVHNFMSRSVSVYDVTEIIFSNDFQFPRLANINTITNDLLAPEVLLGKQIFYNAEDARMTKAGYISCASCHLDGDSDGRVWDFTDRGEGFRNTHSLLGRKGTGMGNIHWTGNFDEIQDFENDMRHGFGGKGFLSDEVFNSGTVKDPLGDKKKGLSKELDALAAYITSLDKVHPSPHRNEDGILTEDGKIGKTIFVNLNCGSCHAGNDFTDRSQTKTLHDVGTIIPSSGKRRNQVLTGFATPTLKGIWETAPYLHDGSAATLKEVFTLKNSNNQHGQTGTLSDGELDKLVSYLLQIDEKEEGNITLSTTSFVSGNKANLIVSPNPAHEHVSLFYSASSLVNHASLEISTTQGQLVYARPLDGNNVEQVVRVNVSTFNKGVYIVTLKDSKSNTSQKLIIQ